MLDEHDRAYFLRRAEEEQLVAARVEDPAIAKLHLQLHNLHLEKATAPADVAAQAEHHRPRAVPVRPQEKR